MSGGQHADGEGCPSPEREADGDAGRSGGNGLLGLSVWA